VTELQSRFPRINLLAVDVSRIWLNAISNGSPPFNYFSENALCVGLWQWYWVYSPIRTDSLPSSSWYNE